MSVHVPRARYCALCGAGFIPFQHPTICPACFAAAANQ